MKNPTYQKLTSFLFYQWENGAKTGIYYLRTDATTTANKDVIVKKKKDIVCTDEICTSCQ